MPSFTNRCILATLLASVLLPGCSIYVGYRIETYPTGATVTDEHGKKLGTTPLVLVERGLNPVWFDEELACVQVERPITFIPPGEVAAKAIPGMIILPRTCDGESDAEVAKAYPAHTFIYGLAIPEPAHRGPAPAREPMIVDGRSQTLVRATKIVQEPIAYGWEQVAPGSVAAKTLMISNEDVGELLMLWGALAFVVSWTPSVAMSARDGHGMNRLAIPGYGPWLKAKASTDNWVPMGCTDSILGCLIGVSVAGVWIMAGSMQLSGLASLAAGTVVYAKGDEPVREELNVMPVVGGGVGGLALGWRF